MKKAMFALMFALPLSAAAADFNSLAVTAETLKVDPGNIPDGPHIPGHIDGINHDFPVYHFGGYREACITLGLNASSPLTLKPKIVMEEYGEECREVFGMHEVCSPVTFKHKRQIIVNIGPRELGPNDTENLNLCMKEPKKVLVNTDGMLYEYKVEIKNEDYLFQKKTLVTLTPGAPKAQDRTARFTPDLNLAFADAAALKTVALALESEAGDYAAGVRETSDRLDEAMAELRDASQYFGTYSTLVALDRVGKLADRLAQLGASIEGSQDYERLYGAEVRRIGGDLTLRVENMRSDTLAAL